MHVLIADESRIERQRLRSLIEGTTPAPIVSEAGSLAGVRVHVDDGRWQGILLGPGIAPTCRATAEAWAADGVVGIVAVVSSGSGPEGAAAPADVTGPRARADASGGL